MILGLKKVHYCNPKWVCLKIDFPFCGSKVWDNPKLWILVEHIPPLRINNQVSWAKKKLVENENSSEGTKPMTWVYPRIARFLMIWDIYRYDIYSLSGIFRFSSTKLLLMGWIKVQGSFDWWRGAGGSTWGDVLCQTAWRFLQISQS